MKPPAVRICRVSNTWSSLKLSWGVFPHPQAHPPDSSVGKESACNARFDYWVGKIRWRRDTLSTPVFLGFPCGSAGKESTCNAGDLGPIPGLGRSPGEGESYPLQYSGLENSMDCIILEVAKSRTRLSDFHFQAHPGPNLLPFGKKGLKSLTQHSGTEHVLPVVINRPWPLALITTLTFFLSGYVGLCCLADLPLIWHPGLSLQWLQ